MLAYIGKHCLSDHPANQPGSQRATPPTKQAASEASEASREEYAKRSDAELLNTPREIKVSPTFPESFLGISDIGFRQPDDMGSSKYRKSNVP